ncbi:hypothetical protein PtrM4_131610 [Pyrenophora tritici-repentis]|uniref:Uncharacterized protein n=1 Tax=Pyrenophora tritici-repentis TaxID=45151 RepID=A0A317BHJ6_9PLEO|nr:hypothetical protein PtrM4_131610 [Pyrenophora tritici-repentis]KAI1586472.1 hypothetical protein PtrEW7m1_001635 [Pyrenophora tritici-repentis]KAI1596718.1 hypothetical protein PtrEW13061_001677 [Pyrenophora tritici-repentis]PWO29603.1 hypothetical protein PtrARCrB10_01805 [Pyrenophora tritici-repentis]
MATNPNAINVNDPTLITLVNKLQDVFTTVGVCHSLPPTCAQCHKRNADAYVRSKTP